MRSRRESSSVCRTDGNVGRLIKTISVCISIARTYFSLFLSVQLSVSFLYSVSQIKCELCEKLIRIRFSLSIIFTSAAETHTIVNLHIFVSFEFRFFSLAVGRSRALSLWCYSVDSRTK